MNENIISILEKISESDTTSNRIMAIGMIRTEYDYGAQGYVITFDNGKIILREYYYPCENDTTNDIEFELYKSLLSLTLAYINNKCENKQ